jgi:hypothetical protein
MAKAVHSKRHDEPIHADSTSAIAESATGAPGHEEVARLDYFHWEARGFQGGSPEEDWFRAEEELKRKQDDSANRRSFRAESGLAAEDKTPALRNQKPTADLQGRRGNVIGQT